MSRDVTTLPPGQQQAERRLRAVPDAPAPRRPSAADPVTPEGGPGRSAEPGQRAAAPQRPRAARPARAGGGTTPPPAPAEPSRRPRTAGLRQPRGTRPGDPAAPRQRPGARLGDLTGLRQRPGPPGAPAPARPGAPAPARPGTRTRPSGTPAGPRPGRAPAAARPAVAGQESRTRFVFLVLGLLVGALISLLLINTVLATGSYEITALQKANVQLAEQRQALAAQIASEQTPAVLYRRARQLGMVDPPLTHFLNLRKGRIISQPHRVPGVVVYPPGYTP